MTPVNTILKIILVVLIFYLGGFWWGLGAGVLTVVLSIVDWIIACNGMGNF